MKVLLRLMIVICLAGMSVLSHATCLDQQRLTGVNLAGAEFGSLPGVAFKDYVYPSLAELTYIADKGANVIRLPFMWERLQPQAKGPLNAAELTLIQTTVDIAKSKGICVILDVHNYAKYYSESLASNIVLQDAFVDLWLKLALVFKDADATAFGLMNEPVNMPVNEWALLGKRTLAELRRANSSNWVFLPGGRWSGAHDWFSGAINLVNATALADVRDPLNRTAIEVHQYFDSDYSGTHLDCRPASDFDRIFNNINAWAVANKQLLFLGEFGVPPTPDCLQSLNHMLSLMSPGVWKGWTYWAAGGWWGDYPMALGTKPDVTSLQWPVLASHFYNKDKARLLQSPSRPKPPDAQRTK